MAIRLPRDAGGHVIPLDTTMMYRNDNSQFHVTDFFYEAKPDKWFARSGSECIKADELYLEIKQEDSIEKLADDLGRTANNPDEVVCTYLNRKWRDCEGCKFENSEFSCAIAFVQDIAARARNLCGDD